MKTIARSALASALIFLSSCAVPGETKAPGVYSSLAAPTPDGVALVIKADRDGENVAVAVGSTIAVELIGVPTAGYMWTAVETPAFIEPAGEYGGPTSSAQLEPGFAGGNHWEAFLFKVTGAGEGVLRFEQRQVWAEESEPGDAAFSVHLFAEE